MSFRRWCSQLIASFLISVATLAEESYRLQVVPNTLGTLPLPPPYDSVDRSQQGTKDALEPPVVRRPRYETHHTIGLSENVPTDVQTYESRSSLERYTNGVGTAPRNSRCYFPFTAHGRRYDDCITEDLGQRNLDYLRHPYSQGAVREPVGEGAGVHIGHGWCSVDHEYIGRWGECFAPGYQPAKLNGGKTDIKQPHRHSQYWNPQSCIVAVTPRCADNGGGEVVTIIGRGFVSTALSATFSIGGNQKSAIVSYVSHKELQTFVPPFPDLEVTTKGNLTIHSNGLPVHFCADIATADNSMHIPQFTVQGHNWLFFASDVRNHRIHKVDYSTGMTDTFEQHSGGLLRPMGLEVGPDGTLYVASSGTKTILRYDTRTLHFLGIWATIPGEPRGIRWKGHELFVVDYTQRRVLRYKHHNATSNWRIQERGRQGTLAGYFTQDLNHILPRHRLESEGHFRASPVIHPHDLTFHAIDGELKLFVTDAHSGSVIQFNGLTGRYEKIFNNVPLNMASLMAFSHRDFNRDLYVSSPYASCAFARFDGTSGNFKKRHTDVTLRKPGGLIILGSTLFLSDREAIRTYDIDSGTILEDAATVQGARLGMLTWNMQCNADYAMDRGSSWTEERHRPYAGDMATQPDAPPTGVGTTQPHSCVQSNSCSWDNPRTDYGAEDPHPPHRRDNSFPRKDYPQSDYSARC